MKSAFRDLEEGTGISGAVSDCSTLLHLAHPALARRRLSVRTKGAICTIYTVSFLGLIYLLRVPLLTGLAGAWIVDQSIEPADAIMVLGGNFRTRPLDAARLYHKGYAPRILLTDAASAETELAERILLKNTVPREAITILGNNISGTYGEAAALRDWLRMKGAHKVIVPSEVFHSRRVSWIFGRVLTGTGAEIRVQTIQPDGNYTALDWWEDKYGRRDFQRELTKFIFYWIRY